MKARRETKGRRKRAVRASEYTHVKNLRKTGGTYGI